MRTTTTRTASVLAVPVLAALLLTGCAVDTTDDPLPTGGDVTGDTSVIESPGPEVTETG